MEETKNYNFLSENINELCLKLLMFKKYDFSTCGLLTTPQISFY